MRLARNIWKVEPILMCEDGYRSARTRCRMKTMWSLPSPDIRRCSPPLKQIDLLRQSWHASPRCLAETRRDSKVVELKECRQYPHCRWNNRAAETCEDTIGMRTSPINTASPHFSGLFVETSGDEDGTWDLTEREVAPSPPRSQAAIISSVPLPRANRKASPRGSSQPAGVVDRRLPLLPVGEGLLGAHVPEGRHFSSVNA